MKRKTTIEKPDYEIAAEELREFYAGLGISHTITPRGRQRDPDRIWDHFAFTVEFWRPVPPPLLGRTLVEWNQGTGIPEDPEPAEVLASIARDYLDTEGVDFEEWAGNIGCDDDSRKAERVYDACVACGGKLRALGLTAEQIKTLAEFSNRL